MGFRVGIGYDIHRLIEGRKLLIGGVEIPYMKGLLGHSDADVLLHALCDALLGALGLGDIGEHFPDSDPKFLDADSAVLLKTVKGLMEKSGYKVNNLDIIIIAQEPKILPFKQKMKERIGAILEILPELVNIKSKTNEGLDSTGRQEAIACWVSAGLISEG